MADLKTDYKDDVLDTSQNINRTFSLIDNTTGTIIYPNVSLEETTVFTQEGDNHSASITNEQNTAINKLNFYLTDKNIPKRVDKKFLVVLRYNRKEVSNQV